MAKVETLLRKVSLSDLILCQQVPTRKISHDRVKATFTVPAEAVAAVNKGAVMYIRGGSFQLLKSKDSPNTIYDFWEVLPPDCDAIAERIQFRIDNPDSPGWRLLCTIHDFFLMPTVAQHANHALEYGNICREKRNKITPEEYADLPNNALRSRRDNLKRLGAFWRPPPRE